MRNHSTTSASRLAHLAVFSLLPAILASSTCFGAEPGKVSLPLEKVVLFNSGVGFFQHDGQVEGNAQAELQFNVDQINDLLMSLVVQDLDGGQVSAVGYGSRDPITKTLATFAIDLTANPTLGELLDQVRGESVELEAPNKQTGVILGVERKQRRIGRDELAEILEVEFLNLLTDDGLRSVPLEGVSRIRLANAKLDAELRKALALLASAHATDKKAVTLQFLGEGKRRVRIGYIQEAPVWKTSYRLVLSDKKPPFLQGWAIVENTTDRDWANVHLTLVSGRPISFIMNLYEPLYAPRPTVVMDLYRSLQPQTYGQDLAREEAASAAKPASAAGARESRGMGGGMFGGVMFGKASAPPSLDVTIVERDRKDEAALDLQQGVQTAAQGSDVGELFQYAIAQPVSIERQKSAMLPIVNAELTGEKMSIYNPVVLAKHPLCGLQLTNSTKLHLMQGPITVFDGGVYAGDAQIEDLAPGGTRLVSYAIDLDTEVATAGKSRPQQLLTVRLVKGTMIATHKYSRATQYTLKNSGREPKRVLIEQPLGADWKLVAPKEPAEKTRDRYRFAVEVKPGHPAQLSVEEEQTRSEHIALATAADDMILVYTGAKAASDEIKAALKEVIKRRTDLSQLVAKRQQLRAQLATITEEQSRIRQNMDRLDRAGDLYKRYVGKLNEQESTIETVRGQVQQLTSQESELRKSLDAYLLSLDLK